MLSAWLQSSVWAKSGPVGEAPVVEAKGRRSSMFRNVMIPLRRATAPLPNNFALRFGTRFGQRKMAWIHFLPFVNNHLRRQIHSGLATLEILWSNPRDAESLFPTTSLLQSEVWSSRVKLF